MDIVGRNRKALWADLSFLFECNQALFSERKYSNYRIKNILQHFVNHRQSHLFKMLEIHCKCFFLAECVGCEAFRRITEEKSDFTSIPTFFHVYQRRTFLAPQQKRRHAPSQ